MTTARNNGMKVIFSSKEIPGEIVDVLMVHSKVADARAQDLATMFKAWNKAQLERRTQQKGATRTAMTFLSMTEEEVTTSLAPREPHDPRRNDRCTSRRSLL